jgi:hypothetical protein
MTDEFDHAATSKDNQFLYAIIDVNGSCWVVLDDTTPKVKGLPWLMRQGWKPIREVPFPSAAGQDYILICLERI